MRRRKSIRIASDNQSGDRKSTRLNSSHLVISYAVFCLKKKKKTIFQRRVTASYCLYNPQNRYTFNHFTCPHEQLSTIAVTQRCTDKLPNYGARIICSA